MALIKLPLRNIMKLKKSCIITLFLFSFLRVFSQNTENIMGIWENGGRFVEFYEGDAGNAMRLVLKPYYATVYDEPISFSNPFDKDASDSTYALSIRYPNTKKVVSLPIFLYDSYLFTSFYKRIDFEVVDGEIGDVEAVDEYPLFGFWVEQGSKDGILLYPNEPCNSFDAYFFEDNKYIKFRYWYDKDLGFSDGKAVFKGSSGLYYKVPKMIKRGEMVYSCITTNGSSLRNYEAGTYRIETDKFSQSKGVFLVFNKEGASPGKKAASDVYPDYKYGNRENIPLYIVSSSNVFAIGAPFLFRSSCSDLDEEIKRHNSIKRGKSSKSIRDEDIVINP